MRKVGFVPEREEGRAKGSLELGGAGGASGGV